MSSYLLPCGYAVKPGADPLMEPCGRLSAPVSSLRQTILHPCGVVVSGCTHVVAAANLEPEAESQPQSTEESQAEPETPERLTSETEPATE